MKRLTKNEKLDIIDFIKKRRSLNYISNIFGKNKSTLYYYYKKIHGKKNKTIIIPKEDDLLIGELIGLFVGDGYCFYDKRRMQYSIRFFFNNKEKSYVFDLVKLFNKKFNKKPNVNRTKNVLVVRYYSKELYNFILSYVNWMISRDVKGRNKKSRTVYLKINNFSDNFKKGFMDSDGYLSNEKIIFSSSSEKIISQSNQFLSDLGFKSHKISFQNDKRENRVGMWYVYVQKSERDKFFDVIEPRNTVNIKMHRPGFEFPNQKYNL